MATQVRSIRRGLPRRPGGEPWPPAGDAPAVDAVRIAEAGAPEQPVMMSAAAAATSSVLTLEPVTGLSEMEQAAAPTAATSTPDADPNTAAPAPIAATSPVVLAGPVAAAPTAAASDRPLRRGLPRAKGSEPWPPAGFAPARIVGASGGLSTAAADEVALAVLAPTPTAEQPVRAPLARPTTSALSTTPAAATSQARSKPKPLPARQPGRFGVYTRGQLMGIATIGGFALLFAAMVVVVSAAWFLNLPFMQDFLTAYPGEYHLPETATPGFPAWVQWQHFFNVFLMVLIIRSGLQVRTEKRPSAFWTPKWSKNGKGKISLALWFHQSLDILWLLNGVIFVVMLFVTGHWMRIVPTSWEVFPNALSAMLQYVSLDWPTENGWVNYNSLQQLMYFITVFIAAPLAALTGVRMSGLWPKNAKTLNRVYPVEWARAIHFPVMLYFVAFIIVHVALVFATGALRNLNHMYDGTDVVNWAGFWIFFVSLLIIVAGWIAARPLVLAPIAKLTGKVTAR